MATAASSLAREWPARAIWGISLPILFTGVGEMVIHATDTVVLGQVGTVEVGAIGIAATALEMWVVPAAGVADATQVMIARRVGERRPASIPHLFHRGLVLIAAVSALLVLSLELSAAWLSRQLASPDVASAVEDFLRIAAFGVFFLGLNTYFSGLYVGLTRTRILVWATLVLALVNGTLSSLLVFGGLGLPRMGIEGAAIGFVAAEASMLALLATHSAWRLGPVYGIFRRTERAEPVVRPLVRLSVPVTLETFVGVARWFAFFLVMERLGETALAISNVAFGVLLVLLLPTAALADVAYTLVSNLIGRGDPARVTVLMRRMVSQACLATLPAAALLAVFPDPVVALFGFEGGARDDAEATLRIMALALPLAIPAELWVAALVGMGDADAAFGIELLAAVLLAGGAYVLAIPLDVSVQAVWLLLLFDSLVAFLLAYARARARLRTRRTA